MADEFPIDILLRAKDEMSGVIDQAMDGVADSAREMSKSVAEASGLYQDAAGKWHTESGKFANAAEKAAAGIKEVGSASKKTGEETEESGKKTRHFSDILDKLRDSASGASGILKTALGTALGTIAGSAISGGLSLVADGLKSVVTAGIQGNAQFETYNTQFGVLLGSSEAAKQRLAELAQFGATTPFELPQVVEADKILQGFGLHSEESAAKFGFSGQQIRTIAGDVAAGTGAGFSEMANLIGKFSSGATGEAISRFQEMGITTREELTKMGLEFSKSGELLSPLPQATEVVLSVMKQKYGGMMDAQSSTFEGMVSNLQDWVGQSIREVSQPIFEVVGDSLKGLLAFLNEPATQAAIKDFAKMIADTLRQVVEWVKENWPAISKTISDVFKIISDVWNGVLKPVVDLLLVGIKAVVDYFVKNWPQISAGFKKAGDDIKWIWDNILKPVIDAATGAINGVVGAIQGAGTWFDTTGRNIQNFLGTGSNTAQTNTANNNNISVTIYGQNGQNGSVANSVQTGLYRAGFQVTP